MPVPVIFAFGTVIVCLTALIVVLSRGLLKQYRLYQAPLNFEVACILFTNATRRDPDSPFLFLLFAYGILLYCVAAVAVALYRRSAGQNALWASSALCGAICAVTYEHIPGAISEALAALTLLSGLACLIFWYTQLPRPSRTSSP